MTKREVKNDEQIDRLVQVFSAFTLHYGSDETKLEKWQQLCSDCGLEPPGSIVKCKKALKGVHVNIHDLIKAKQNGTEVRQFSSKKALKNDLARNRKRRFPINMTKSGDNKLLQAFLVSI